MNRTFLRRATAIFLPPAAALVLSIGSAYAFVQQDMRIGANDQPQQLAEDSVIALDFGASPSDVAAGPTVDVASGLRPFVAIYNMGGTLIATNGSIAGASPAPPIGVLVAAQESGRNAVTWQPQADVRIAAVVLPWRAGTVLAGRSLRLVEERIYGLTELAVLAALGGLLVVGATAVLAAILWPTRTGTGTASPE